MFRTVLAAVGLVVCCAHAALAQEGSQSAPGPLSLEIAKATLERSFFTPVAKHAVESMESLEVVKDSACMARQAAFSKALLDETSARNQQAAPVLARVLESEISRDDLVAVRGKLIPQLVAQDAGDLAAKEWLNAPEGNRLLSLHLKVVAKFILNNAALWGEESAEMQQAHKAFRAPVVTEAARLDAARHLIETVLHHNIDSSVMSGFQMERYWPEPMRMRATRLMEIEHRKDRPGRMALMMDRLACALTAQELADVASLPKSSEDRLALAIPFMSTDKLLEQYQGRLSPEVVAFLRSPARERLSAAVMEARVFWLGDEERTTRLQKAVMAQLNAEGFREPTLEEIKAERAKARAQQPPSQPPAEPPK